MPDIVHKQAPKSNPELLLGLVGEALRGKVVLPDFQRSFVWSVPDIEELLVSILQGYFIGTFLLLDTLSDDPLFPPRLLEGVPEVTDRRVDWRDHPTVRLVLDGQQRLTAVFYALYEPPIPPRWARNPYKFYLDVEAALRGDIEDAVIAVSAADKSRLLRQKKAVESFEAMPLGMLREEREAYKWLYSEQNKLQEEQQRQLAAVCACLQRFMVPVVSLPSEADKEDIVSIFERINRTGVFLSLFDLAGARLYSKNINLRKLWEDWAKPDRPKGIEETIRPEAVLKLVALLRGKEPRKRGMLDTLDEVERGEFEELWRTAVDAISKACERLERCYGVVVSRWIPYTTMIVPLAALLYALEEKGSGEKDYAKVDRWYWASVFTNRYDRAADSTSYRDFQDVMAWVGGGSAPEWVERANVEPLELQTDERQSAKYKGVMCVITLHKALDFLDGQAAELHECEDDHIFPRSVFADEGGNSVFNRSLISQRTNRSKSNKKPSEFVPRFLENHGGSEEKLLKTLRSHLIDEDAYKALLRDDFDEFLRLRGESIARAVNSLISTGSIPL